MFLNFFSKNNDTQAGSSPTLSSKPTNQQTDNKEIDKVMNMWAQRLVSNDNTISYENENFASDKKDKLQQAWQGLKKSVSKKLGNTVYTPLTFYEFHMVDHLHKLFKSVPLSTLASSIPQEPYISNYLNIIAFTKQIVVSESVSKDIKRHIIYDLQNLSKQVKNTKFADPSKKKQSFYTEAQTNILLMILTFKSLEKDYNPYVRRVIKRIFNQLSADSFMNTMQTLRYLENQRAEVQIMPQLKQEELTRINDRILQQTHAKYRKQGTIPKIQLKKVSQDERRKVVTILVSGFLSEGQDKKDQWKSLLACMPDSEVYGLDWQSQAITNLLAFMGKTVGDLVFSEKTLEDKFADNPFNNAFQVAQESGKYLAHIVDYLFPNQFINIIGYSLGTELIKQFVKTTIELNKGKNLQKIILLGGVSDIKEYDQILSKTQFPLSITNMYTDNDSVLEVLLKRCRKGIQPVGLKQLVKSLIHSIDNTDVSSLIKGHLQYMLEFGKIADMLELSQE